MANQHYHDKFAREILSDKDRATEFLLNALPPQLTGILQWQELKIETETFIDENLKEIQADFLFSLKTKSSKPLQIYILLEHKSSPIRKIHLQLLKYLSRIYNKQKKLCPIIPLVFYHGKKNWNIPLNFLDIFKLNSEERKLLETFIPNFNYSLFDLSRIELESLHISLTMTSFLYSLKNIWDIEKAEKLKELINISKDLFFDPKGEDFIQKLLIYIYHIKGIKETRLRDIISHLVSPEKGEIAMTTAELLKKEGIKEGIKEGKEKEKTQTVLNMHKNGFDVSAIGLATNLSEEKIRSIITSR